jgi:hypothetical protein
MDDVFFIFSLDKFYLKSYHSRIDMLFILLFVSFAYAFLIECLFTDLCLSVDCIMMLIFVFSYWIYLGVEFDSCICMESSELFFGFQCCFMVWRVALLCGDCGRCVCWTVFFLGCCWPDVGLFGLCSVFVLRVDLNGFLVLFFALIVGVRCLLRTVSVSGHVLGAGYLSESDFRIETELNFRAFKKRTNIVCLSVSMFNVIMILQVEAARCGIYFFHYIAGAK